MDGREREREEKRETKEVGRVSEFGKNEMCIKWRERGGERKNEGEDRGIEPEMSEKRKRELRRNTIDRGKCAKGGKRKYDGKVGSARESRKIKSEIRKKGKIYKGELKDDEKDIFQGKNLLARKAKILFLMLNRSKSYVFSLEFTS